MTRRSIRAVAFVAVAMILLSGCRSFSPPVNYYTLSSIPGGTTAKTATLGERAVTIGILPVELPGYIDRSQMVRRMGPNQLEISSLHRWADYPDTLVQQLLEENLQTLVPRARVLNSPWPVGVRPDVTITFRFLELIGTADKKMLLNAMWDIAGGDVPSAIQSYRINLVEPMQSAGFRELAAAHSRVLATLCRRVAESLPPGSS
jgi:uncharacterized protein